MLAFLVSVLQTFLHFFPTLRGVGFALLLEEMEGFVLPFPRPVRSIYSDDRAVAVEYARELLLDALRAHQGAQVALDHCLDLAPQDEAGVLWRGGWMTPSRLLCEEIVAFCRRHDFTPNLARDGVKILEQIERLMAIDSEEGGMGEETAIVLRLVEMGQLEALAAVPDSVLYLFVSMLVRARGQHFTAVDLAFAQRMVRMSVRYDVASAFSFLSARQRGIATRVSEVFLLALLATSGKHGEWDMDAAAVLARKGLGGVAKHLMEKGLSWVFETHEVWAELVDNVNKWNPKLPRPNVSLGALFKKVDRIRHLRQCGTIELSEDFRDEVQKIAFIAERDPEAFDGAWAHVDPVRIACFVSESRWDHNEISLEAAMNGSPKRAKDLYLRLKADFPHQPLFFSELGRLINQLVACQPGEICALFLEREARRFSFEEALEAIEAAAAFAEAQGFEDLPYQAVSSLCLLFAEVIAVDGDQFMEDSVAFAFSKGRSFGQYVMHAAGIMENPKWSPTKREMLGDLSARAGQKMWGFWNSGEPCPRLEEMIGVYGEKGVLSMSQDDHMLLSMALCVGRIIEKEEMEVFLEICGHVQAARHFMDIDHPIGGLNFAMAFRVPAKNIGVVEMAAGYAIPKESLRRFSLKKYKAATQGLEEMNWQDHVYIMKTSNDIGLETTKQLVAMLRKAEKFGELSASGMGTVAHATSLFEGATAEGVQFVCKKVNPSALPHPKYMTSVAKGFRAESHGHLGLKEAFFEITREMLEGSGVSPELIPAIASAGMSVEDARAYEEWYMDALSRFEGRKVIGVGIGPFADGGLTGRFLEEKDPVGPLLGVLTGCCQHPDGAASDTARHGLVSKNGTFFVIELKGEVVLQSHVWKEGDVVVFDSLEGTSRHKDVAIQLVKMAARTMVAAKQCKAVHGGNGYQDAGPTVNAVTCSGEIYTHDSSTQYKIA